MAATIDKRRERILTATYENGHINVRDISQKLGISEATVRRDLHELADEGLIELAHGGAKIAKASDYSFISKSLRNTEAKRIIAKLAADLIGDGEQIFLDSGTTCSEMAKHLRTKKSISIIVNSIRTAQDLQAPGVNVLMLGGQFRPDRMDCVGPIAYQNLNNMRGYTAFLGTDGMSRDFGFTSIDIESANIFGLAVKNSKQAILLADSSKFDNPALHKTTEINSISAVITEKEPDKQWCRFFKENNIQLIYPK